jgi:outer membrane biosynthesis protein TonB
VQALAATPGLQGRVSVQFVVDTDGWVRRSRVWQSDLGDSKVAECIARELVGLQFPQPDGKVTVIYPFTLSPEIADAGS